MRIERSAPRTVAKTTAASTSRAPSSSSVDPTPPSPEKKSVRRMIAPKSAMEAAATISWPNGDAISPESFSTGTITPSATTTARANGHHEPERGQAHHGPAQLLELDLETGEEEDEAEPHEREHLDHLVDVHDAEHGRADHDARDDLDDDRGQPQPREEAEQERSGEGDRDHDEQVGEGRHAQTTAGCPPATTSVPLSVRTNVSSAFAPAIEGFHANAWPASITASVAGVAISSREA